MDSDQEQERYIQEQIAEMQQQKLQEEKLRQQITSLATQHSKTQQENVAISTLLKQQQEQYFSGMVTKQSSTGLLNHKRFLVLAKGFLAYYSKAPPGFSGEKKDLGLNNEVSKSCIETSLILHCDPMKPNKFVVEFYSQDKEHKKVVASGSIRASSPGPKQNTTQIKRAYTSQQQVPVQKTSKWTFSCESPEIRDQWVTAISLGKQAPIRMQEIEEQLRKKQDEEDRLKKQIDKTKEAEREMKIMQERRRIEKQEEMQKMEAEKRNRQLKLERERIEQEQAALLLREEQARLALQQQEEELRIRMEHEAALQAERELREAAILEEQRIAMEALRIREEELQAILAKRQEEEMIERMKEQQQREREHLLEQIKDEWQYQYLQAFEVNTMKTEEDYLKASYETPQILSQGGGNPVAASATNQPIDEDVIIKGQFLYSVASRFKSKATSIAQRLIEDHLSNTKNFIPTDSAAAFFSTIPDGSQFFIVDNIAFRMALSSMREAKVFSSQLDQTCLVYSEDSIKYLSHEFKALNALNNAIIEEMKVNPNCTLRVPLACMIEFKGIVVLAIAIPSIEEEELSLQKGIDCKGNFVDKLTNEESVQIRADLLSISSRLNLKPHGKIELTKSLQVHRIAKVEYEAMRNCENGSLTDTFAPKNLDVFILLKCANLFPLDISLQNDRIHYPQRLRQELVRNFPVPLNSDGFIEEGTSEIDELQLTEAATILRTVSIKRLIQRLENLDLLPLDSIALTEAFHNEGVNMRYLGDVVRLATKSHVKEICCVEIAARVCKKILRNNIVESMRRFHDELGNSIGFVGIGGNNNGKSMMQLSPERMKQSTQKQQQQSMLQQGGIESVTMFDESGGQNKVGMSRTFQSTTSTAADKQLHDNLLDFLNLLLGSGTETEFFWESIIYRQAVYDFHYGVKQKEIVKGAFVHAVKLHCSIEFEVNETTGIFEQLNPFSPKQVTGFLPPRCHVFDFEELPVNQSARKYAELMANGDHVTALPALNLKLAVLSWMKSENSEQEDQSLLRLEEVKLLSDLSELLFSFNNYEESTAKAVQALDISPIAHVCQVKSLGSILKAKLMRGDNTRAMECFDRAVSIIEFHLGIEHPLHSILYSILGHFYSQKKYHEEAIALYKSSLANSIKSLGPTHLHTAEVYKDLGSLFMKMGQLSEAFTNFEQAYTILANDVQHMDSIVFAQTVQLLATLCLTQGKFEDSQFFVSKAIEIFTKHGDRYLKDMIDAYLVLCRVQEMAGFQKKCLQNADTAWVRSRYLGETAVAQSAQESLLKIVFQISAASLSGEDAAQLTIISNQLQNIIEEERRATRKLILTSSNALAIQYFMSSTSMKMTLSQLIQTIFDSILDNAHFLLTTSFFTNYRASMSSEGESSELQLALQGYENLLLVLTNSFAVETLRRN